MNMDKREKCRVWLMSGVALSALVILAAGLSELELLPGWPLSEWVKLVLDGLRALQGQDTLGPIADVKLVARILPILSLILFTVFIIGLILYPDVRKWMLRESSWILIFLLLAYFLTRSDFVQTIKEFIAGPAKFARSPLEGLPEFEARSPSWLIWAASFALALALAAGIAGFIWAMLRRLRPKSTPMEELVQETQAALDALKAGADFRNTIIRCYSQMSETLLIQRGLQRDGAMTPREFEVRLTQQGLPGAPVHQLTLLFEAVRYGAAMPGKREEEQAITCLTAIIEVCRSG
jgi:hypothetical protein